MRNFNKPIQGLPDFPGITGNFSVITNLTVYVDPVFGTINRKLEDRNVPFNNLRNTLNAVRNSPVMVSYHVVLSPGNYSDMASYSGLSDILTIQSYDDGVFFRRLKPSTSLENRI